MKQAVPQAGISSRIANVDTPTPRGESWVEIEWRQAKALTSGRASAMLVVGEVQTIPQRPKVVKRLQDEGSWGGSRFSLC